MILEGANSRETYIKLFVHANPLPLMHLTSVPLLLDNHSTILLIFYKHLRCCNSIFDLITFNMMIAIL